MQSDVARGFFSLRYGAGQLVATAIHSGHALSDCAAEEIALSEQECLREEDPFTDIWTAVAQTSLVVHTSRFELDLNRPRDHAIYRRPEDAWGLDVWKSVPSEARVAGSLRDYDFFYASLRLVLDRIVAEHGRAVLFDLHTYNHRRDGADASAAPAHQNPEVNVGTGTMDRLRWGNVVDRFMKELRSADYFGRSLDVRENVRFRGGQLVRWVHENYPTQVCALAIEVKKFFMDEWSGEAYTGHVDAIGNALAATVPGTIEALNDA